MESNHTDEIDDLYIYTDNESISKEMCEIIINKYINDERKQDGSTSNGLTKYKISKDISITKLDDWKEIDNYLYEKLNIALKKYSEKVIKKKSGEIITIDDTPLDMVYVTSDLIDFGYQVQSYKANEGYYDWHSDNLKNEIKNNVLNFDQHRILTFIWYLNDVELGGETEFLNFKIKPTAGKLLLFPATWTYLHRGNMPISNDKFIVTGWLGNKLMKND